MLKKLNKKYLLLITAIIFGIGVFSVAGFFVNSKESHAPSATTSEKQLTNTSEENNESPTEPAEPYQGVSTSVANNFTVKVPNGWQASISENPSFLAIMFARPNQLQTLIYDANAAPAIDRDGIPSWNGLTEHFFILKPTAAQAFNPDDHLEVSSQSFTFDDGTVGQSYYVVKHAEEAENWGGLKKDTEWQGRTYIYEKDGKRVEAHLAVYPSTGVSISFFEDAVRTISF